MNRVINLLKNHRSIRKFKDKPISKDQLNHIIESATWAATSNFIQAYSVIHVTDKSVRKEIADLAGPQIWVETSPVFLVFCADLNRSKTACKHENKNMVSGYTEQFIIATVDVALAAQNAMIAAESMGMGGVYIGGIRNNPEKVCLLLKLPDHVYPVFGMCLGYPDDNPEQKPRLPVKSVLMENVYHEHQTDFNAYNDICRQYYKTRTSDPRDETWTCHISRMVGKPMRPHMKSFLKKRGFEFK